MRDRRLFLDGGTMQVVGALVLFGLWGCLLLFQAFAFFEGLDAWFGLGTVASILAFVVAVLAGQLGSLAMIVVAIYGMIHGWGWPWWQAVAVACPLLAIGFLMAGSLGITTVMLRAFRRS